MKDPIKMINEAAYIIALKTMAALGEALPWILGVATLSDVAYAIF